MATWRVDDDENSPEDVHPERDEALSVFSIGIFHRHSIRIAERLLRVRKAHAVFARVLRCLGQVKVNL